MRSWTKEQRGRRTKCKSQVVSRQSPQAEVSVKSADALIVETLFKLELTRENPQNERSEIGRPSLHIRGKRDQSS